MHEEKRHGFADNVAPAQDDGIGAFDLDVVAAQDFHAARGRARDKAGAPADEAAEIDGVEAVDVFRRIDRFQDALGVHLWGKRELNQNAVNIIVAVQIFDHGEHVEGGYRGRRREKRAGEADLFASRDFTFDVELRGGIVANEDGRETGANARGREQANFVF